MASQIEARKILVSEPSLSAMLRQLQWDNDEDRAEVFSILAKQLGYDIQG